MISSEPYLRRRHAFFISSSHQTREADDGDTVTFLEHIQSMWHLLRCDADLAHVDIPYSKPVLLPRHRMNALYVGYEIRAGRSQPDAKIYVPLFQFHKNDASVVVRMMEQICERRSWDFQQGGYERMMKQVL